MQASRVAKLGMFLAAVRWDSTSVRVLMLVSGLGRFVFLVCRILYWLKGHGIDENDDHTVGSTSCRRCS